MGDLGFLHCDYIGMCVVNKQFELLEFVFNSVYVDRQYDDIYITFTAGYACLCVVMWLCLVCLCGGCGDCDACAVICVGGMYAERVRGCGGMWRW